MTIAECVADIVRWRFVEQCTVAQKPSHTLIKIALHTNAGKIRQIPIAFARELPATRVDFGSMVYEKARRKYLLALQEV